ncbi:hypothetical protein ZOSMA_122G00090 [Zostera marina]|uniref:Uncharacterized protein n=1 Tax=Zostera marina TaxID=29655 RepID=A0A0K9Q0D1_ZOSMR|nr:hypothetical protein ZOSMA_122G00090 [Zostera marina]
MCSLNPYQVNITMAAVESVHVSLPAEAAARSAQAVKAPVIIDKSLHATSNLVKLLPTCTVLTFQALYPSFSNRGMCYSSNRYLTSILVFLCSVSCIFFSFTDSLVGRDGKHYFGMATSKGMYLFNHKDPNDSKEEEEGFSRVDLEKFKLRPLDYVHAFFSVLVFLTLTFNQSDLVRCLFPEIGAGGKQLLNNLPLGAGFLSSLVFIIFPSSRKGIGYSDATPSSAADRTVVDRIRQGKEEFTV